MKGQINWCLQNRWGQKCFATWKSCTDWKAHSSNLGRFLAVRSQPLHVLHKCLCHSSGTVHKKGAFCVCKSYVSHLDHPICAFNKLACTDEKPYLTSLPTRIVGNCILQSCCHVQQKLGLMCRAKQRVETVITKLDPELMNYVMGLPMYSASASRPP